VEKPDFQGQTEAMAKGWSKTNELSTKTYGQMMVRYGFGLTHPTKRLVRTNGTKLPQIRRSFSQFLKNTPSGDMLKFIKGWHSSNYAPSKIGFEHRKNHTKHDNPKPCFCKTLQQLKQLGC
jgi:hypothetical protein